MAPKLTLAALSGLERTFTFRATANPNPSALTAEQIERFNRDGFVGPCAGLGEARLRETRLFFDRILADTLRRGESSYSINSAHLKFGPVYDLLCEPTIVRLVRDLLGPNVIGWAARLFCKMPRDPMPIELHQDCAYWALDRMGGLTVWLALDDTDPSNAAVEFVPGSHKEGMRTHVPNPRSEFVTRFIIDDPELLATPRIPVPLKAGQLSLHSDLVVHGSRPNSSDRRRSGLTLRYVDAAVAPHLNWSARGIVVCGADVHGHWDNPSRPAAS